MMVEIGRVGTEETEPRTARKSSSGGDNTANAPPNEERANTRQEAGRQAGGGGTIRPHAGGESKSRWSPRVAQVGSDSGERGLEK